MKKKSFLLYYILTFLLLALVPLFSLLFYDGSLNFDAAAERATEKTGVEWTSNIIDVTRLIIAEPILLLNVLGSAVPFLAALVTLFTLRRKNKWKVFWGRLIPLRSGHLI